MRLHGYQEVARDFLRGQDRAALFLDMGLGKTACTLTALEDRHLPVLVVAPKRVAEEVWGAEQQLWRPDLRLVVAAGSPTARANALASDADIVVIGRDNLRDALTIKRPFNTLVLDELSGFKTRASVRWKAARKLIKDQNIKHVWGLTGTPNPNGYMDLWAQLALLDGGARLGKTLTAYRDRYFVPGRRIATGIVVEWKPRPEAPAAIQRAIEDICLAMATDGRITLPAVTHNVIEVELPPAARRAYNEFASTLVVDLTELIGGEVHTASTAAVLTARLSQMTSGFVYVDDADLNEYRYTELHHAKIDALREIIEAQSSPILVFYRFNAEKTLIQQAFPEAWTIDEPHAIAKWNAGEVPLLVAHPASAGHGLNLQHGGHTVVWMSPTWDLEHYEQANKRLARQGQKHPVVIHHILARNTIDTLVQTRLAQKAITQFDLLAYLESPV